jgi:hypothetical protein
MISETSGNALNYCTSFGGFGAEDGVPGSPSTAFIESQTMPDRTTFSPL